ncbi:hypothetical protein [Hymenobacter chitinivorans]|nr:hypothetical protein [Hymenobacter chitinivorans]
MKQREVTTPDNTQWTCVQAYSAQDGDAADKAATLSQTEDGGVPVVCTPSGGAQTIRLELELDWLENLSDEELTQAIQAAQ